MYIVVQDRRVLGCVGVEYRDGVNNEMRPLDPSKSTLNLIDGGKNNQLLCAVGWG